MDVGPEYTCVKYFLLFPLEKTCHQRKLRQRKFEVVPKKAIWRNWCLGHFILQKVNAKFFSVFSDDRFFWREREKNILHIFLVSQFLGKQVLATLFLSTLKKMQKKRCKRILKKVGHTYIYGVHSENNRMMLFLIPWLRCII
jgi:hypothetical protein